MSCPHGANKAAIAPFRTALYNGEGVAAALAKLLSPDATIHMCHPFGDLPPAGYGAIFETLTHAMPDVEFRDYIVAAGEDQDGAHWVGCGGSILGTFVAPWLDIPPTGHLAHMRYHDFFRFEGGRVVEVQSLWDIPELMMQAGAWPMAPSLGREWHIPGPACQSGLGDAPRDASLSCQNRDLIVEMLAHMKRHPAQGGPEVMEMARFWHPKMMWYGPAGIGTGRGIAGFRNWHQIPFLNAMPDRGQYVDEITYHFFADNAFAAVTGWPNMIQTVTGDGWMGIAPAGRKITMRSLDFWRIEDGLIRENWVLVDLLDAYAQLGVDVFARLREFNKARVPGAVPYPVGAP